MRRGDLVIVALPGDLGKPRPAVVMQSDLLAESTSRLVVLPLTTTIQPAPLLRVAVAPSPTNGLREESQVMVDRVTTVARDKVGGTIGSLDHSQLAECTERLLVLIGAG